MVNRLPTRFDHFPGPKSITLAEERALVEQKVERDIEWALTPLRNMARQIGGHYRDAVEEAIARLKR